MNTVAQGIVPEKEESKQSFKLIFTKQITKEEVEAFTKLSGDDNPIHLNDTSAKEYGFDGGAIVHGALVNAFLSTALKERFGSGTAPTSIGVTKFKNPVYVGSVVEYFLHAKSRKAYRNVTFYKVDVEVRIGEKLVVSMQDMKLVRPKKTTLLN